MEKRDTDSKLPLQDGLPLENEEAREKRRFVLDQVAASIEHPGELVPVLDARMSDMTMRELCALSIPDLMKRGLATAQINSLSKWLRTSGLRLGMKETDFEKYLSGQMF